MGISLREITISSNITLDELKGKILAVDSYNLLYQFLTTIRSRGGSLLQDSGGNTTSHLVGLFSRVTKLMQTGLKLAFIFDGAPPKLKEEERKRRRDLKVAAEIAYKEAVKKKDLESMRKYASRTSRLTPKLVEEAKKLVELLGLPMVQAPSEGEAQAAHMAKNGAAYAIVSQDFDSLIHGAQRLVRNLSIAGKRKMANKLSYANVEPEMIVLTDMLNHLGIDQEQLIVLALLVGTDYNSGGVKGIGPKKALGLIKKHNKNFDALFKEVDWDNHFEFPWTDVYYLIKKMPVTDDYELKWGEVSREKIIKLLVDNHDFSEERVSRTLDKLDEEKESKKQKGLSDFF